VGEEAIVAPSADLPVLRSAHVRSGQKEVTATLTFEGATTYQAARSYISRIFDVEFRDTSWRGRRISQRKFHDDDTYITDVMFNKLSPRVCEVNFQLALKARGRWGSAFWGVLLIPFGGIGLVILLLDWKRAQIQEDDMTTLAADRISAVLQDEVGVMYSQPSPLPQSAALPAANG